MNGTILTKIGLAELLNAPLTDKKVKWNKLVVGDGNGSEYIPTEDMTSLKNELWRGNIIEIKEVNSGHLEFHAVIPADVGPFIIREAGLLNENDQLVAIAPVDNQNKVSLQGQSGTSNDMDFIIGILIDNAENIEVTIDPNIAIASQQFVDDYVEGELLKYDDTLRPKIDLRVLTAEEVEAIFDLKGGGWSGYPEEWEEATEQDIDLLFSSSYPPSWAEATISDIDALFEKE